MRGPNGEAAACALLRLRLDLRPRLGGRGGLRTRCLLLLVGEAHAIGAEGGGDLVPGIARLDVAGVIAGHRPVEAVLGAVAIDPAIDGVVVAAGIGDVDRLAVAVAADARLAAVHRVAGAGRKPRSDALAIVVAERAEHRP